MSAVDPNQGRGPSLVDLSARLDLADLHAANIARQAEWCPEQVPDLSFRGNELGGECGEAQNVIMKLERERLGWRGSRATLDDLGQELADVVICADLCAVTAGIDLAAAVRAKFNATSEKIGLSTRLEAPTPPQPPLGEAEVRRIVREVCARLYDDEGLSGVGEPDEAALIRSGERDECLTWSFAAGLAVAEHLRSAALPSASTGAVAGWTIHRLLIGSPTQSSGRRCRFSGSLSSIAPSRSEAWRTTPETPFSLDPSRTSAVSLSRP